MKTRKKKGTPKKVLALLLALAVALFGLPLTGCGQQSGPLRVLVDLDDSGMTQQIVSELEKRLEEVNLGFEVEIETFPAVESDGDGVSMRKSAATRVRAEIMAGEGPDIFLSCFTNSLSVFIQPEKSMYMNHFYPLDALFESEAVPKEKMQQTVLSAGRTAQGQMFLPITYTFHFAAFLKEDVEGLDLSKERTWDDMMTEESGLLESVASVYKAMDFGMDYGGVGHLGQYFGPFADFEQRALLFTEQELLAHVQEEMALLEKYRAGAYRDLPDRIDALGMGSNFYMANDSDYDHIRKYEETVMLSGTNPKTGQSWGTTVEGAGFLDHPLTFVPVYSRDSGVSAMVDSFAAVNANTKRPAQALKVLETLLDHEWLYGSLLLDYTGGTPIYDDYMTEEYPWCGPFEMPFFLSRENFEAFSKVRDQITSVTPCGTLNAELTALYTAAKRVTLGFEEGSLEDLVHQTYRTMRQAMDE